MTMPYIWYIVQSDTQCPGNRKTYSQQLLPVDLSITIRNPEAAPSEKPILPQLTLHVRVTSVCCASGDGTLDPGQRARQDKGFALWVYSCLLGSQAIFTQ